MTKDEALKLALEALEYIDLTDNDRDFLHPHECYMIDEAITAIKEALSSPNGEAQLEQDQLKPVWGGGPTNKDYEDAMRIKGLIQFVTPPQRTWVGLTDDEVEDLYFDKFSMGELKAFALAIEAKLRSKNT